MSTNKKLLLLDWGIGGLSVYREVKRLRPNLSCVYVSDSGFTPYGKVPAPELAARVSGLIQNVTEFGLWEVVIACNAASTVLSEVREAIEFPVTGMIEAGVDLVKDSGAKRVGVIGGVRTIESKIFSTALADQGIEVREQVAQLLSALIEAGELEGKKLRQVLTEILRPLKTCDAILLACTHYPAVSEEIQRLVPKAKLLDPAARVAATLNLPEVPLAHDLFFTTGSAEGSDRAGQLAFGVKTQFVNISV